MRDVVPGPARRSNTAPRRAIQRLARSGTTAPTRSWTFPAHRARSSVPGMDIMQQFLAYAGDFEKTLVDDDWARLRKYFADDAVYEVKAKSFGCHLTGPTAIFAGIRKTLNGFDRKFTKRDIEVTSGPEISGDQMQLGWKVVYTKDGVPPFVLRGSSTVRYAGEKIAYLADSYDQAMEQEMVAWQSESGMNADPSY